jgi:hypothetical protein
VLQNNKQISVGHFLIFFGGFGSNAYYLNPHHNKRTWTIVFGAISLVVILLPTIHNFRIWSFLGVLTTTYTAWYMFSTSIAHGQVNLLLDRKRARSITIMFSTAKYCLVEMGYCGIRIYMLDHLAIS